MTSGRFRDSGGDNNSANTPTDATTTATNSEAITQATSNGIGTAAHASEHIRRFVFTSERAGIGPGPHSSVRGGEEVAEKLEIKIPELLQGGYSFYTWPCAPLLAWFLWERRQALAGKRILELGSGTALPGILAAKCGARVVLSDNCILPKSLAHIRRACLANSLVPGQDVDVVGLSWGLLLNSVFNLGALDLIIAADCFYDPTVFEDIIVSVAFLLERNSAAKFLFTYQERSADWSIEALLKKWKLCARQVNIDDIGKSAGLDLLDLLGGGHTIHLIEVTKEQQ